MESKIWAEKRKASGPAHIAQPESLPYFYAKLKKNHQAKRLIINKIHRHNKTCLLLSGIDSNPSQPKSGNDTMSTSVNKY